MLESIKQILEYYETRPEVTEKVYVLEDCMSSISGYEDMANQMFEDFRKRYRIQLVKSTDGIL